MKAKKIILIQSSCMPARRCLRVYVGGRKTRILIHLPLFGLKNGSTLRVVAFVLGFACLSTPAFSYDDGYSNCHSGMSNSWSTGSQCVQPAPSTVPLPSGTRTGWFQLSLTGAAKLQNYADAISYAVSRASPGCYSGAVFPIRLILSNLMDTAFGVQSHADQCGDGYGSLARDSVGNISGSNQKLPPSDGAVWADCFNQSYITSVSGYYVTGWRSMAKYWPSSAGQHASCCANGSDHCQWYGNGTLYSPSSEFPHAGVTHSLPNPWPVNYVPTGISPSSNGQSAGLHGDGHGNYPPWGGGAGGYSGYPTGVMEGGGIVGGIVNQSSITANGGQPYVDWYQDYIANGGLILNATDVVLIYSTAATTDPLVTVYYNYYSSMTTQTNNYLQVDMSSTNAILNGIGLGISSITSFVNDSSFTAVSTGVASGFVSGIVSDLQGTALYSLLGKFTISPATTTVDTCFHFQVHPFPEVGMCLADFAIWTTIIAVMRALVLIGAFLFSVHILFK